MARDGAGGQGAPHRAERGGAGDDPPRARVHPITALQTRVLAVDPRRRGGDPARPAASSGIGFVAYSPLGRGFLSGRFKSPDELDESDFRRHGPALPGRGARAEPEAGGKGRGAGRREGLHAGPACARVGAGAGRRRRPDPRDQATQLPRGEPRGGRHRAVARTTSPASAPRCRPPTGDRYDAVGMTTINR